MDALTQIEMAELELDRGNVELAHRLLEPHVLAGNAKAILVSGTMGKPGETDEQFERRHVQSVELAAQKGDPEAIYRLGVFFDTGEFGFELDKVKASTLFKRAADLGHLRCQWIHACELLWGLGSYEQNIPEGLAYLRRSIDGNFIEAVVTMARIHENGEFGYEKDKGLAAVLLSQAARLGERDSG